MEIRFVEGQGRLGFINGRYAGKLEPQEDGSWHAAPADPQDSAGHHRDHYDQYYFTQAGAETFLEAVHTAQTTGQEAGTGGSLDTVEVRQIRGQIQDAERLHHELTTATQCKELIENVTAAGGGSALRDWGLRSEEINGLALRQASAEKSAAEIIRDGAGSFDGADDLADALDTHAEAMEQAVVVRRAPEMSGVSATLGMLEPEEAAAVEASEGYELTEAASIQTLSQALPEMTPAVEAGPLRYGVDHYLTQEADQLVSAVEQHADELDELHQRAADVSPDGEYQPGALIRESILEHTAAGQDGSISAVSDARRQMDERHDHTRDGQYLGNLIAVDLEDRFGTPNIHAQLDSILAAETQYPRYDPVDLATGRSRPDLHELSEPTEVLGRQIERIRTQPEQVAVQQTPQVEAEAGAQGPGIG